MGNIFTEILTIINDTVVFVLRNPKEGTIGILVVIAILLIIGKAIYNFFNWH